MGIFRQHVIPMIITYMLQGTIWDTIYGENICSVLLKLKMKVGLILKQDFQIENSKLVFTNLSTVFAL